MSLTGRFDLTTLAIVAGLFLLVIYLIVRNIGRKRAIENLPLTALDHLRQSEMRLPALPAYTDFSESGRPMQLRLSSQARGAAVVVGVFALIGMGIAWGCAYRVSQDVQFAKESHTALATVKGTDVSPSGKNAKPLYRVRYEFAASGQTYEGSGNLSGHKSFHEAEKTQRVSIQYLGSDPRVNRPSETPALPIAVAFVTPLVLFLPLFIFVLALWRDRELLTKGRLAVGQVIGIVSGGRRYSLRCYYDFADAVEQVRRGSSWLHWYAAQGTKIGSPVHVVYLSEDPRRSSLLLALLWRF